MLEIRRSYPGPIVGTITALAIIPAALRKVAPSLTSVHAATLEATTSRHAAAPRLQSPFALFRNLVIGGGVSTLLLYPEVSHRFSPPPK